MLGGTDLWFWGSPFHSLRKVVEFTLVDRLSSRGYQPLWYYVTSLNAWTSIAVAALAVYGARGSGWRVTIWWALPLAMFSLLPHKEPRYLIALLPFVCLSAALGLNRLLHLIADRGPIPVQRRTLAIASSCSGPAECCWRLVAGASEKPRALDGGPLREYGWVLGRGRR